MESGVEVNASITIMDFGFKTVLRIAGPLAKQGQSREINSCSVGETEMLVLPAVFAGYHTDGSGSSMSGSFLSGFFFCTLTRLLLFRVVTVCSITTRCNASYCLLCLPYLLIMYSPLTYPNLGVLNLFDDQFS